MVEGDTAIVTGGREARDGLSSREVKEVVPRLSSRAQCSRHYYGGRFGTTSEEVIRISWGDLAALGARIGCVE